MLILVHHSLLRMFLFFSSANRWKEVLTTCATGVVTMLQKLVEIMPDTVVVRLIYVAQDVIKTTMRLLLVCSTYFFFGANFSDILEHRHSLPACFGDVIPAL